LDDRSPKIDDSLKKKQINFQRNMQGDERELKYKC